MQHNPARAARAQQQQPRPTARYHGLTMSFGGRTTTSSNALTSRARTAGAAAAPRSPSPLRALSEKRAYGADDMVDFGDGLRVSPMGLGTWAWGNRFLFGYKVEEDAELQRVFNLGVVFVCVLCVRVCVLCCLAFEKLAVRVQQRRALVSPLQTNKQPSRAASTFSTRPTRTAPAASPAAPSSCSAGSWRSTPAATRRGAAWWARPRSPRCRGGSHPGR